ncbi:MAG: hypothetical protein FJ100_10260 [Deltaproteobacteria bacterium]|nr:hypothetical protein [Deltaproteobacteria bacterium]
MVRTGWVAGLVLTVGCGGAAPPASVADSATVAEASSDQDTALTAADAATETANLDSADAGTEIQVARKVVTGTTKVTKPSTSASFTLTLVGPMTLHVAEDGHYDLTIEAGGPVKFLAPKVAFQQHQLGTKGLQTPKIADGAAVLTYKVTGVVPAAAGKWKLAIDVKDADGAVFDIDVAP